MKDHSMSRTPQQIADDIEANLKALDALFCEASPLAVEQLDKPQLREFRKLRRMNRRFHSAVAEFGDEILPDDMVVVLGGGT